MSLFGKRKPRVIQTLDDEDADLGPSLIGGEEPKREGKLTCCRNSIFRIPCAALCADKSQLITEQTS